MRFFSSSLALSAALFGGCNDPAKQSSPAGNEASTSSVSVGTSSSSVNAKSSDPAVVGGKAPSRRASASSPNADLAAIDAAIDHMNGVFSHQSAWKDDAQKNKYTPLATLNKVECQAKIVAGIEKLLASPDLQAKLIGGSGKDRIAGLKAISAAAARTNEMKEMAETICKKLAQLKTSAETSPA